MTEEANKVSEPAPGYLNIEASPQPDQPGLQVRDLVGRSAAVLGSTGQGKTNTAAVLVEELLAAGVPLTIVDIEAEYWTLREKYDLLVAGQGQHVDLPLTADQAGQLARLSVERGLSVILDLSEMATDESHALLLNYFQALWHASTSARRPYQIVLEEAHEWLPQGVRTPLKEVLTRIALRGRKRGLGIIMMSQRSAKLEKDVLTQAQLFLLHKVFHPVDLKVYQDIVPLPPREVDAMVAGLSAGQAILLFGHQARVIQLRLRHTTHAGATPELDQQAAASVRKLDSTLLDEIKKALAATGDRSATDHATAGSSKASSAGPGSNQEDRQLKQVKELTAQNAAQVGQLEAKDKEIARLRQHIAGLEEQVAELSKELEEAHRQSRPAPTPTTATSTNMHVQAAHVTVQSPQPSSAQVRFQPAQAKQPTLTAAHQQVLDQAERRKREKEEAEIRKLVERLNKLTLTQRNLLLFLHSREGTELSTSELATWLGYTLEHLQHSSPSELIKMGFISRRRYGNEFVYKSLCTAWFQRNMPGVDPSRVLDRIIKR